MRKPFALVVCMLLMITLSAQMESIKPFAQKARQIADAIVSDYGVGFEAQGKTLVVSLPENAAYAVYDSKDVCVNFTTVSKKTRPLCRRKARSC